MMASQTFSVFASNCACRARFIAGIRLTRLTLFLLAIFAVLTVISVLPVGAA